MKNPAVGIMRQAQADFLRGCACFGLTPADRPKLTAAAAQPDAEPDLAGPRLAAAGGDKPKYY